MRTSLGALLTFAVMFGVGYWYLTVGTACAVPIRYHIGTIDPRFNISAAELRESASFAESLWEVKVGRNLFEYTESDGIPINLIFDERQEAANEEAELRDVLQSKEGVSEDVRSQYEELLAEYEALKRAYDERIAEYEGALQEYNSEVSSWNEKGGAPKAIYEELEATKQELEDESNALNAITRSLNELVRKMNTLAARGNTLVEDYNSVVEEYNDRFSEGGEFTQGDYRGKDINIYQFDSREELTIVLAHEFGHALDLGHVGEETAIMYHLMEKQSLETGVVTADIALLESVCQPETTWLSTVRAVLRGM